MKKITTQTVSLTQKTQLFQLWNSEYPKSVIYKNISDFSVLLERYEQPQHILLVGKQEKIYGWYCEFFRNDEKWFFILLNDCMHGQGFGTQLLNLAKETNTQLNGWVIDHNNDLKNSGAPYRSPLGFYIKNGFVVLSDCRIEQENTSCVKIQWKKSL